VPLGSGSELVQRYLILVITKHRRRGFPPRGPGSEISLVIWLKQLPGRSGSFPAPTLRIPNEDLHPIMEALRTRAANAFSRLRRLCWRHPLRSSPQLVAVSGLPAEGGRGMRSVKRNAASWNLIVKPSQIRLDACHESRKRRERVAVLNALKGFSLYRIPILVQPD